MTTQREEIEALVGKLDTEKTRALADKLDDVLGRAQNAPEYGGLSDGSVSPEMFGAGREVGTALHQLARAIDRLHLELGRKR